MDTMTSWSGCSVWLGPGIMLAAALLCAIWGVVWGWGCLWRTRRAQPEAQEPGEEPAPAREDGAPLVSVIAYAQGLEGLDEFIEGMAGQDTEDFELIVVTDAGAEATSELSERYAGRQRLYFTFLPPESRNVSRLKLAYTIGIKAARGEAVMTTSTSVRVPSASWVRLMSAPLYEAGVDIVLGYCRSDLGEAGASRWWKEFDSVVTSSQWVASALAGRPYRGDRRNLLFRRRLFFEHDGYSATNHLQWGDDDLFVAGMATGANTRVVLAPDAIPEEPWGETATRVWRLHRQRYGFTARLLPRRAFRAVGLAELMQWLVPLLCAGAAVWGMAAYGEWWPIAAAGAIVLGMWGCDIAAYRGAASRLEATRLWWSVVPFMMWRPLGGAIFRMRHRREKVYNYTWQRPR